MRPANDAVPHSTLQRVCREIETPVKLMRLDADERDDNRIRPCLKQLQISQVGLDVFVDRMDFDVCAVHNGGRHALQIWKRGIRHVAAPKSFDVAIDSILAWFDKNDFEPAHGS